MGPGGSQLFVPWPLSSECPDASEDCHFRLDYQSTNAMMGPTEADAHLWDDNGRELHLDPGDERQP